MDDSLSLAASDAEELSGSVTDPALLPPSSSLNARFRMDEELIRIMTKTVSKKPSRSRLDEWFLPGRNQAPCQCSSPFFPEVHDKLTKSWHAPYSSRIRPSASAALTSIAGAEEKGYERLPPLDESVAMHFCLSNCLSGASHGDSAPRGFLQGSDRQSTQSFPENAGPYGSSFASTSVLRMRPIQFWLKQWVPSTAWRHGRHRVTVTWACVSALADLGEASSERPLLAKIRSDFCWRDLLWLK